MARLDPARADFVITSLDGQAHGRRGGGYVEAGVAHKVEATFFPETGTMRVVLSPVRGEPDTGAFHAASGLATDWFHRDLEPVGLRLRTLVVVAAGEELPAMTDDERDGFLRLPGGGM